MAITLVASSHRCYSQLWKDLDGGFGCYDCPASGYEIAIDELNNRLLLSGTLYCGNDCEDYRVPALWDGQHWEKLGESALHINFLTIGIYNNHIYSNNPISGIDGYDKSCFIKWNENSWDTIAGGAPTLGLYSIIEHNGYLYASGAFEECAGDSANLVFRYDGETVEPLVEYFDSPTYGLDIEFYHDTLFVGGSFRDYNRDIFMLATVYDFDIHKVAQGLSATSIVEALEIHDNKLWIGGRFSPSVFGIDDWTSLAYYDGHSIKPSPWQPDGQITALKSYNNELYIAGWFAHIEDVESHCVAKINDFGYYALNPDTVYNHAGLAASYQPGIVRDMEIWNDTLYLAGAFGAIGLDTTLNSIAKLNRALSATNLLVQGDVSIYPNPTNGNITLETINYFNQSAIVKIYDTIGRHIQTEAWALGERKKEISLNQLASGVYLITIETADGLLTKRIIKD